MKQNLHANQTIVLLLDEELILANYLILYKTEYLQCFTELTDILIL